MDLDFKGQHLTPGEVDQWFSGNERYLVYRKILSGGVKNFKEKIFTLFIL